MTSTLISQMSIDQTDYQAASVWGLSTAVDLYDCDPNIIRSRDCIVQFTCELCDLLEAQVDCLQEL